MRKTGPEAKIISLFTALSEDSKRIVLDIIKAQTATPRKASKPREKSKPKDATTLERLRGELHGGKESPGNGSLSEGV